jgi:hypothetical protein
VVTNGYNATHVLNADNLELLPELEGLGQSEAYADPHAFTADGRLVALRGTRYSLRMGRTATGKEVVSSFNRVGQFVGVWDTKTGKALKVWERDAKVAFSPVHPTLVTTERNGTEATRIGFWNFAADE